MNIELREPNQITRRGFFDLAAKAVAALAVAGTIGKVLAEEATTMAVETYRMTMNVAVKFTEEHGWIIGSSYVHPESGAQIFVSLDDKA